MMYNRRRPRMLLTGATGQVGRVLVDLLREVGDVVQAVRNPALLGESSATVRLDLCDESMIRSVVRKVKPEIIANAAAYTNVDQAEDDPDTAWAVNARAPAVLATEISRLGGLLVHFSTDYVFAGRRERPWRESDPAQPLNTYGRTKLAGERAIRSACPRRVILRSSWVYDAQGRNFFTNLLRQATEGQALRVVTDQVGAQTPARVLAHIACQVIDQFAAGSSAYGTYHATCSGACSRFEFAGQVLDLARRAGIPLRSECITPIRLDDCGLRAARPRNCQLCCQRLQQEFGITPPTWRQPLPRLLEEWQQLNAEMLRSTV